MSVESVRRRGRVARAAERREAIIIALPWVALGGAALIVLVGLLIGADGGRLGTPLPPFNIEFSPGVDRLAVVSALGLAAGVLLAPLLVERVRSRLGFAVGLYGLGLCLGLCVNLARAGTDGWWTVFATGPHGSFEGRFEYLLALPLLRHGVAYYIGHFAALFPYMTTHVKGNPPGPLVALHLLGISGPIGLAALCIGLGSLSGPLAYDLGRTLGGEERGRVAGVLTAFAPSILLFGVSSADYVFATMGLAVACLLVRPGTRALVAGGVAAALASFFSWLLLAIPVWSAVVVLLRSGRQRALLVLGAAGLAVLSFDTVLGILYGYDPIAAVQATSAAYAHGVAATRPYAFWLFGSPAAWALMLGLPIAWLALRSLTRGDAAAVAVWGLVAFSAIVGLTKAETERIWLPFVPLACVAAAAVVRTASARLRPLLAVLAIQALAVELLFFTVW